MSPRPRILFLVPGIAIGDPSGGGEAVLLRLAYGLDADRFERAAYAAYAFQTAAEQEWRAKLRAAGVELFGMQATLGGFTHDLRFVLPDLWRCVQDFRPQVVVTGSDRLDFFNAFLHLAHPVHPGAVRIMQLDKPWLTHRWVGSFIFNGLFPLAFDVEIAQSRSLQEMMSKRWLSCRSGKPIPVIYNAIDEAWFGDHSAHPLPEGMPEQGPRLGVIGRLTEQKGHSILLQALPAIRAEFPVQVVFVGVGPLEESLRLQAQALGIADAVHFLGMRRDIAAILSHLDIFVLPSLYEGYPTVILEANACGTPVVATDVSGSRELVRSGETGWLCPVSDPARLAEAILEALRFPELAQRYADRARQEVTRHTVSAASNELAGYLEKIIR